MEANASEKIENSITKSQLWTAPSSLKLRWNALMFGLLWNYLGSEKMLRARSQKMKTIFEDTILGQVQFSERTSRVKTLIFRADLVSSVYFVFSA